jgi:two-component system, OmpR family, response regulator ChvI
MPFIDSSKGKVDSDESVHFYLNGLSEEISFSGQTQNFCVCFVDMIGSTKITAETTNTEKVRKYYSIFINTMAVIARNFDAKIIKNTGDCLITYFPKTSDSTNKSAFKDVIECGLTMIEASPIINAKLKQEGLLSISYRISADYGAVEVARSVTSQNYDLFGSTVNLCAKINSKAPPNGMVIGGDLYQIVKKSYDHYRFEELGGYSIVSFKHPYPIYSVISKNRNTLSQNKTKLELGQILSYSDTSSTAKSSATGQRQRQRQPGQRYPYNVLLVDDEPDALLTYKTFLTTAEGYNIDAFTDPQEALKHFAQVNPSHYDLAVMDIRMPGLNGLQLYYRLKAMNMSIKVLFLSALDAAAEIVSILPDVRQGDIIRKPIDQEHFVNAVKTALA